MVEHWIRNEMILLMVQKSGKLTSWYGKYPIICRGFYLSQVVSCRISEPSTFQDGKILWSYFKPEFGSVPGAKLTRWIFVGKIWWSFFRGSLGIDDGFLVGWVHWRWTLRHFFWSLLAKLLQEVAMEKGRFTSHGMFTTAYIYIFIVYIYIHI